MKRTMMCLMACAGVVAGAAANDVATRSKLAPPRLVVLISIDQLRGDYLTRWLSHFCDDGFKRLMRRGAHFDNAYYSYGCSATAPGHATLVTGRLPRQHGIVGNKWFLEPGITRGEYAVVDPNERIIGLSGIGVNVGKSPHRVIGSALGDEMKLADRRSRVYTVSLKDRTAIFSGGKNPDGVFWWDKTSGRFITSTYYMDALPQYVQDYNTQRWSDQFCGKRWEPLLAQEVYAGTHPLDPSWHPTLAQFGAAFPHDLPDKPGVKYYSMLYGTPFGNELVLEISRRLVSNERLGRGPAPDLLVVGLSSNDPAGHIFGPQSAEVLDITVRADRQVAAFLDFLDEQVGLERCLIALTGDHGVSPAPAVARQARLRGGLINPDQMIAELNRRLFMALGAAAPDKPLVLGMNQPWLYCDPEFERLDEEWEGALTRVAVDHLCSVPGVAEVVTAAELRGPPPRPEDTTRYLAWRCYHPERSGQLYLKLEPFWYRDCDNLAGHNSGFRSDRHVSILLSGPRIRPGRYSQQVDATDLAVTLATVLGVQPPSDAVGRVLHEALDSAPLSKE